MRYILTVFLFSVLIQVYAVTDANPGKKQTVCVGSAVYVQGNDPLENEEAYWIDIDGFIESPGDTIWSTEIEQLFPSEGMFTFSYEIRDDVDTSKASLIIEVLDVPTIEGTLTINDGCEGETVQANLTGSVSGTVEWSVNNEASIRMLTGSSAEVVLPTDGSLSVEVTAIVSNECGASEPIKASNTISLKPKDVPVITSGNGADWVCSTKDMSFLATSKDATSFTWKWSNEVKLESVPTTKSLTLFSHDFSGVINGVVEVVGVNACGEGEKGFLVVDVVSPEVFSFSLVTDMENNAFCINEDEVTFTVNPGFNSQPGLEHMYEFSIGSQVVQESSVSHSFTAKVGDLTDGSSVSVIGESDQNGCYTIGTYSVVMDVEGYDLPSFTLTSTKEAICEKKGEIELKVEGLRKGDFVLTWSKDGSVIENEVAESYIVSGAEERGEYEVVVANEVCSQFSSDLKSIMIYEQPIIEPFSFLTTNTLMLEFDELGTPIKDTKEVFVSGLVEDELTAMYSWSSSSSDLIIEVGQNFAFTANKGIEDTVTLVVTNGQDDAVCSDSLSFYIKEVDGVGLQDTQFVSNALYPNPVTEGQEIFISADYKSAIVEIYAADGAKIMSKNMKGAVSLGNIETGVYVVKIKKEGQVFVSKLIVE